MITEFETQLANVLGARLPAPHTGRVAVAPGAAATDTVQYVLGVTTAEVIEADFLAHRDRRLLGSPAFRRVVHLRCHVQLQPVTNQGRLGQLAMLDAIVFALDAPDFRDGSVLLGGDDPGFLIECMRLERHAMPLAPDVDHPAGIDLVADGWFWPVGLPEEAGPEIEEARVRAGLLPVQMIPAAPRLAAGGDPVELTIRLGTTGTMRLQGVDVPPEPLPFGSVALTLLDAGGRPGTGTLAGGDGGESAGDEIVRIIALADGAATVMYTPADAPGIDYLVVALDDGEEGRGAELARFRLQVR
jgi:hypothetical protein